MAESSPADRKARAIPLDRLVPVVEMLARPAVEDQAITAAIGEAFSAVAEARTERPGDSSAEDDRDRTNASASATLAYALFKHLARKGNAALWQALRERIAGLDRDQAVLELWGYLERRHGTEVADKAHSVFYHRLWLFDWLLRRYDLRRARCAAGGGHVAANLHLVLLAAVGALAAWRWSGGLVYAPTRISAALLVALYAAVALGLAWSFHAQLAAGTAGKGRRSLLPQALTLAVQSLVPRLAAAGAVGVVILASSQELLGLVVQRVQWGWLVAILAAAYGYIVLEMTRRIHPLPGAGRLVLHGLDLWATALAHGLALALLAEVPLSRVLRPHGPAFFDLAGNLSVTVFIFAIGLVVNLIWADQPVTEPL